MEKDPEIFKLIELEHQRQKKGIELIASENFVSDEVMKAMGSCLTNKYAEGYPGHRYYGGCGVVDQVEDLARDRVKQLFGAEYANVQPHSGAQANMAVFMACMKPGDTFMGLNLAHGGHLSHGSPVNFSGLVFNAVEYNVDKETGRIDYDQMEARAKETRPKLIVGGASAYKYTGVITGDSMQDVMMSSGALDSLGTQMNMDEAQMEELLSGAEAAIRRKKRTRSSSLDFVDW